MEHYCTPATLWLAVTTITSVHTIALICFIPSGTVCVTGGHQQTSDILICT